MKILKMYIADDGTAFENEEDCKNHEISVKISEKNSILQSIKDIDLCIWKKYHPDYKENDATEPELCQAAMFLKTDIESIMIDFPDSEDNIISMITNNFPYGNKILKDYLDMEDIRKNVEIRTDFLTALKSVKKGSDLSKYIDWSFSSKDLSNLAKLHKSNKCRRKIEDLLEDCNFHYECGKFMNKEYGEFLK